MGGRTDGRMDGQTDWLTHWPTDRLTDWLVLGGKYNEVYLPLADGTVDMLKAWKRSGLYTQQPRQKRAIYLSFIPVTIFHISQTKWGGFNDQYVFCTADMLSDDFNFRFK